LYPQVRSVILLPVVFAVMAERSLLRVTAAIAWTGYPEPEPNLVPLTRSRFRLCILRRSEGISLGSSSRSASWTRMVLPFASRTPAATAAPLPALTGSLITFVPGNDKLIFSASPAVTSVEQSSTTITSTCVTKPGISMARSRSSVVVMTPDSLYIGMMMVRYNVVVYSFEVKGSTQIRESNGGDGGEWPTAY